MWRLHVPTKVRKDLRHVPVANRLRILAGLDRLAEYGLQAGNLRHLGRNEYRLRIGDYRVLFRVRDEFHLLEVQRIERRTSTTYRKRR
jgi:mRNA-degrading endonuclease RelE of RelBE toxin-antitoxin system